MTTPKFDIRNFNVARIHKRQLGALTKYQVQLWCNTTKSWGLHRSFDTHAEAINQRNSIWAVGVINHPTRDEVTRVQAMCKDIKLIR